MVTVPYHYSVDTLREWVRANAPDLRLGKLLVQGKRVCFARFSYDDEVYELSTNPDDANPDERIVRQCVDVLRRAMGLPTERGQFESLRLEQDIMRAAAAGRAEMADSLGRELVMRNAQDPEGLNGRTQFHKRQAW